MRRLVYGFFLFTLLLATLSCQKKSSPTSNKEIVRINFTYSPFSVDPRKCTDPVTTVMSFMLYEGLTRLEPDGTVSLALAERIKISEDRMTYHFYLRDSKWSDGTPLTAYDFEASWKKVLSSDFTSRSSHFLFPIKNAEKAKKGECSIEKVGIKALDQKTLQVTLEKPIPYFLELTSFCVFFPTPKLGQEVPHPNQKISYPSNGPFCLKSWTNDDMIVAEKNPYYWNASEVKLDGIHATIIPDEATALKLFEKGGLDWLGGLISPLPLDAVSTLKQEFKLRQRPIAGTTISAFNISVYPLNNVNIRKAFAYAVHRANIIDNISQMFDDIATGPVPQVLKKHDPTLFFPDNAEELAKKHFEIGLQELGIIKEEFPTLTYNYFSSELQRNIAIYLQNTWKEVLGVDIEIKSYELKTHLSKLTSRDFQMGQMSWIGQYHDRMSFLERFDGKDTFRNYSGWESPRFMQIISDSYYKEGAERSKLLDLAEKIIADEMPVIPLYHYHLVYVKNPHLKQVAISPLGDIQFHKAYLTK